MTMPHLPVPVCLATPETPPIYPGTVPGNPYADMQPAPQVAAPPGQGLGVASICLGIIGLILCASGTVRRECIPHLVRKIPLSKLSLPSVSLPSPGRSHPGRDHERHRSHPRLNGRKRVQDPRHERMYKVGVWMNAAPMIVFLVAEITAILWLMGGLIYPGRLCPIALDK